MGYVDFFDVDQLFQPRDEAETVGLYRKDFQIGEVRDILRTLA